jgi:site-specific DNA recombinase
MRAVLYARFSTEKQRDASIDDQFRACERVAAAQRFEVVARFEDRGISGGTAERPGYQSLLALARAGGCDVIVTEDISRLWRNRSEYGQRSAELEDIGIHLVTCVGDDTRRDGWGLILGIKQAISEHARREISYRTKRGLEGLALAGKSTGGRCFGYGDSSEAETVRRIFESRARGLGYGAIAKSLAGIPAPRGGAWARSTVKAMLSNPRFTGQITWGRTEARGGAADSRRKRRVARVDGPVVTRQDPSQRLITEDLWSRARCA